MSTHYLNLYNSSFSTPKRLSLKLSNTIKINRLSVKSNIYLEKIKKLINYNNKNIIILLHFDEKWDRSILSKNEFKVFFWTFI